MFRVHDAAGEPIAATFDVEADDMSLSLVLHSAGGGASRLLGGVPRNADYTQGLETLLRRLGQLSASITDAYVDSDRVQTLSLDSRRLEVQEWHYPIRLADVSDYDGLRRGLTRAQKSIGSTASSGGNERRKIRVQLEVPRFLSSAPSADRLGLILSHSQTLALDRPQMPATSPSQTPKGRGGQGFSTDVGSKLAIEQAAMDAAYAHYDAQGWTVEDVSTRRSYDLHCSRGNESLRVEVKGSTQPYRSVLLSPNEVTHALAHADAMSLFVLSDVRIERQDGVTTASGGSPTVVEPWILDPERLSPTGYSYALDG